VASTGMRSGLSTDLVGGSDDGCLDSVRCPARVERESADAVSLHVSMGLLNRVRLTVVPLPRCNSILRLNPHPTHSRRGAFPCSDSLSQARTDVRGVC
jgi:hypothetical protein